MITSAQNPKLKLVRALAGRPKDRREAGAFLAEGARLVEEALAAGWPIRFALYAQGLAERPAQIVETLARSGVEVESVEARLFNAVSETETSQGILAVLELSSLPGPASPTFTLILDQIRDPGNLGTLLRSAQAAGVGLVLIPPETSDPFAPKVVRAGMGAHFRLPILRANWTEIRARLSKTPVYLAETENAVACWQVDFKPALALIVGSEAEGASPQARALAAQNVVVPMPGGMESLNAAVAGSVLMFEVVRQRSENK
ncbi:MAG: RNA methyltransferase [Anaerolineales bacterium]|nr:RNA methyltransferase [Anaerolineales bacterium]